jgi:hypothetical protein
MQPLREYRDQTCLQGAIILKHRSPDHITASVTLRLIGKIPLLIDSDQCRVGEYPQTASCNQTHEGISKC